MYRSYLGTLEDLVLCLERPVYRSYLGALEELVLCKGAAGFLSKLASCSCLRARCADVFPRMLRLERAERDVEASSRQSRVSIEAFEARLGGESLLLL